MVKRFILFIGLLTWFGAVFSQPLPNLEGFKGLAEKKANEFSQYIALIASKSTDLEHKDLAIQQALKLFINDTVSIQVSFCPTGENPTIYQRTLKKYLIRLSILNYDKVSIEWVEVMMVNDLHKGPDGNFYGTISIMQKFSATKGDYVYEDVTTKHLEVVLKPYKKPNDIGEDEWHWNLFLSNVNIVEPCL